MYGKAAFALLALFAIQAQCVTEIWLADRDVEYTQNSFFGVSIGITKWWWDYMEECHVIVPDGSIYEAYPKGNLPSYMTFLLAAQPFTDCSISIKGIGPEMSGTYELLSLVRHSADNSLSLTRQRNHLTVK